MTLKKRDEHILMLNYRIWGPKPNALAQTANNPKLTILV